jgi:RNA polymerase sigma factor (sigma-70 family)
MADAPALTAPAGARLTAQMHPDDAAAVAKARRGDEDAFRLLVERHSRSIYRLAYRMTGRPEDAEDVVQEAFVKAYRALDRYREGSAFRPWLLRIVANETRNLHRSAGRRAAREARAWDQVAPLLAAHPGAAAGSSGRDDTAEALERSERRAELVAALGRLATPYREVVTCRYLLELDEDETAAVLGRPRGTVKSRLHRALRALEADLRAAPGDDDRDRQEVAHDG